MTDPTPSTELARVDQTPDRAPARIDTDSWTGVVADVSRLAAIVAPTEFVPRAMRDNPAAVTAAVLYGREVGLPPMASLTQTHVIEGRPSLSAEASRAKVIGAGHEVQVLETTGEVCRMRARRRGSDTWTPEVVWTMDMARAAGLAHKSNWRANPRRMLQARASGELCHLYFPDVLLGFAVTEELEDERDGDTETETGSTSPTTTVKRAAGKRAAKKATPSRPAPAAQRPAAPAGPPLPGEDGAPGPVARPAAAEPSPPDSGPGEPAPAPPVDDRADDPRVEVDEVDRARAGRPMNRAQSRMLFASLGRLGISTAEDDRAARLDLVSRLVGRPVDSTNGLRHGEASTLIDTLARCRTREHLEALLEHGTEPPPLDTAEPESAEPSDAVDPDAAVDPDTDADVVDAEVVEDGGNEDGGDQ